MIYSEYAQRETRAGAAAVVPLSSMARLSAIIAGIHSAQNGQALKVSVLNGLAAFGFDNFIMGLNARDKHELVLDPVFTTWPDSIAREYEQLNFIECDPIVEHFIRTGQPIAGRSRVSPLRADALGRRYLDYLDATPLAAGVVIRLPSTSGRLSGIAASSSLGCGDFTEAVPLVSVIARVAMMKAESLGLCADDAQARLVDADLSAHQIEILHWAGQGKSNAVIAEIIGQSKRAIDYHVGEILRKLKVSSRSQAIALASGRRP